MIKQVRKILKVFDENNLFDHGIELIGSWCFMLYQEHLGVKPFPFRTLDIDFLIPVPYRGKNKIDLCALLEPLGFTAGFNSDGSIYLWSSDLKIEFLTPERGAGSNKAKYIENLSLKVIPLRFVSLLFDDPITINYGGVRVAVPNLSAFSLHKLLISVKRKKKDKQLKDLEQAILVFDVVDSREVKALYNKLPKPWQKTILKVLVDGKKTLPLRKDIIDKAYAILISR